MAGSGALAVAAWAGTGEGTAIGPLLRTFAVATALHLLLVLGEIAMPSPTAHAHLAERQMTRGRFRGVFWSGTLLAGLAIAAPWVGVAAVGAGLAGLYLFEHAYVQAGQSVPLA